MRNTLHSLAVALVCASGFTALAQQPYSVIINGTVNGCAANSFVRIVSLPSTLPAIDIDVPVLPPNCSFTVTLNVASQGGGFTVSTPCNGAIQSQVVQYQVPPNMDSTAVSVTLNCGNSTPDCLGVPGGSAQPGSACTDPATGQSGFWDANCACIPSANNCQACFNVISNQPWSAGFINCSSGTGPFTYEWWLPDGSAASSTNADWVFTTAGTYGVCLTIADAGGCTSVTCDTIYVDANGTVSTTSPEPVDCLGIPNGPNVAGSPCTDPATGATGTWEPGCNCIPTVTLPCEADFWVLQAYQNTNNGDTTQVEPIPFQLWIWNLSSGGTGNYQFLWSFGDGTSSTEAFPTHTYAGAGPYQLCLTITDDAGCTSTHCETIEVDQDGFLGMAPGPDVRSTLTINVIQELPTGITERTELEAANLWPNPVQDRFTMQVNSSRSGTVELSILDLHGREVYRGSAALQAGSNRMDLGVDQLESGIYLLRLTSGRQASVLRFVKN